MMRTRWMGGRLWGVDWASDGKWDWTSDIGDRHSDFLSVAVCRRPDNPPVFRITLGPLCLMFSSKRDPA